MECNRDEATRAKEIAERKFAAKDVSGAKKLALKAQNLFPGLEGLQQMLTTLDVYLSAENKTIGEPDWYAILGTKPGTDEDTMKKQYRKLALMLHPDKNKSIGADGAFKMISEAWGVLGDKHKRTDYDQRMFLRTSQHKVPTTGAGPSAPPGANGFHNFSNNTSSKVGAQKNASRASGSTPAARQSKNNTFWTACHQCKMQYEYLRIYLNHNLLCPNCHQPFLAKETALPPSNGSKSAAPWPSSQPRQKSHTSNKNMGSTGFNQTNFQWGPFSKTTGAGSANASPATAAQAATVVQQAYEKVKKDREEAQAAARRQEALRKKNHGSKRAANAGARSDLKGERPSKKRNVNEDNRSNVGVNVADQMATGNGGAGMHNASGFKQGGHDRDRANVFSVTTKPNSTRELTQSEVRNMLEEKARREIKKKLNEWSLNAGAKSTEKEKDVKKDNENQRVAVNSNSSDQHKVTESIDTKKVVQDKKESLNATGVAVTGSITVPDPDFHDFDRDRSERSFGANQVWAAYDDDDGMPRYYAMIHTVISLNPFKMKISWLNSKTNSELGPIDWVGSGFAKTCGDFRVGKYEVNNIINSFSHRVRWTKGIRGAVRIFPRKGDTWALYRNWSPDWNELTPDEVIHKYDMVEVLNDFNEEQGVFVTPLVKVAGFKTVFHRHLDPKEVKKIPKEEMFRFSHQVPSYLLTGSEARNAPKGCRELDPAATPLELLQVITEAKEEEMVQPTGERMKTEADEVVIVDIADDKTVVETRVEHMVDDAEGQSRTERKKDVVENAEKEIVKENPNNRASEKLGKSMTTTKPKVVEIEENA